MRLRLDPFRRAVLLLVLMALPIQGAFAASRWLCAGTATDALGIYAAGALIHTTAGAAAHRHDNAVASSGANHAAHQHHDSSGAADPTAPSDSHQASDTCRLCAACCLTATTAPALPMPAVLPPSAAVFPAVTALVLHISVDGPERPPRSL